jgi:hypothetical protein
MTVWCTLFVPRLRRLKPKQLIRRVLARVEKASQRRLSLLDPIIGSFPKLDVAGSIPVSRSMFSVVCGDF